MHGEDRGQRKGRAPQAKREERRRGGTGTQTQGYTQQQENTHVNRSSFLSRTPFLSCASLSRPFPSLSVPFPPDATGSSGATGSPDQTGDTPHTPPCAHRRRLNPPSPVAAVRVSVVVAPSAFFCCCLVALLSWLAWLARRFFPNSRAGPLRRRRGDDDADSNARRERSTAMHSTAQGQAIGQASVCSTLNLASRDMRKVRSKQEEVGMGFAEQ